MDQATRFTETMLRLYGHEKNFDVALESEEELRAVKHAFELKGCAVERDPLRLSISVACDV